MYAYQYNGRGLTDLSHAQSTTRHVITKVDLSQQSFHHCQISILL